MNFRRRPKYLRLSLLSTCNLQCSYCLPSGNHRSPVVAPVENVRSAIEFLFGAGIRKIRFTGGEPTLYRELCDLVAFIKGMDRDVHTAVTSNGVLLQSRVRALVEAGLDSINISLDTLDPDKFKSLTGSNCLKRVISGIDASAGYIKRVKLNCVLIKGVNDDEMVNLISFANNRGLDIRFIEFMPNRYSAPGDQRFISSQDIRALLPWDLHELPIEPNSAARYYAAESLSIKVGFISSVSHPFCENCDRLRLTADGLLHTCLYESSNVNLFELLAGDPQKALKEFEKLLRSKQFDGCHCSPDSSVSLPSFSAIGG